jgi:hypothetical protein
VLLPHAVRRKKKGEEREKREEKEGKKKIQKFVKPENFQEEK